MTAPKPLDTFEAAWQTARLTVRRTFRGKRWLVSVVLVLLPCAIGLAVSRSARGRGDLDETFYSILDILHFGIAVPGTALVFATAFPWPDADDGSLVWWYALPVRRSAIHIGRFASALALGIVLLPVSALLLGGPLGMPGTMLTTVVAATLLAYPAYLALFFCLSTWTRHAVILGAIFVVMENLLVFAQGNVARVTLVFYVRSVIAPAIPADSGNTAAQLMRGITPVTPVAAAIVFAAVTLVALGLSLLLVERIEYRGKSSQAN